MAKLAVGILLFDGVEVLDFAGPFEVFSRTRLAPGVESRRSEESAPFQVFTVAASPEPVRATGGLADTITDYTEEGLLAGKSNGFSFVANTPVALL